MGVLMMRIRVMSMAVCARQMAMPMRVLARSQFLIARLIAMYMVDVVRAMRMLMTMVQQYMVVPMRVPFHQVQDYTQSHQGAGHCPLSGNGLSQKPDRKQGPEKWRNREIRAHACRAQVAQSDYKQGEAGPITCKTQCAGCHYNGPRRKRGIRDQCESEHQVGGACHQAFDHGNP